MSLTQFIKRPAIRQAFKELAIRERTPVFLRRQPLLIPDTGGPRGLAGIAFDYVARFHLARELRNSDVKLLEGQWIAEIGANLLDQFIMLSPQNQLWADAETQERERKLAGIDDYKPYWRNIIAQSRSEVESYIRGTSDDIRAIAELAQSLAQLDLIYRTKWFEPGFRPLPSVTDEVLRLLELCNSVAPFKPQSYCWLNPEFVASKRINGADADIVIDGRLLDIKTTVKPSIQLDQLLQLAGYAALQRLAGVKINNTVCKKKFHTVEIYFARYGCLFQRRMEDLFPCSGFDQFCEVFKAELKKYESECREFEAEFQAFLRSKHPVSDNTATASRTRGGCPPGAGRTARAGCGSHSHASSSRAAS